jgi:hypothetical protein
MIMYHNNLMCRNPLHVSGVKRPSSGGTTHHNFQPANSEKRTQLTPKTASVVPPEDGRLITETCTGLRQNKVFVKVSYVILIIVCYLPYYAIPYRQ